jgi:hypothetical protein
MYRSRVRQADEVHDARPGVSPAAIRNSVTPLKAVQQLLADEGEGHERKIKQKGARYAPLLSPHQITYQFILQSW